MSIKVWLDDIRTLPGDSWTWVKTYEDCINLLKENSGQIDEMSFDHDLGELNSGYDVISWIEEQVRSTDYIPPKLMYVHSANPVGAKRIQEVIKIIEALVFMRQL